MSKRAQEYVATGVAFLVCIGVWLYCGREEIKKLLPQEKSPVVGIQEPRLPPIRSRADIPVPLKRLDQIMAIGYENTCTEYFELDEAPGNSRVGEILGIELEEVGDSVFRDTTNKKGGTASLLASSLTGYLQAASNANISPAGGEWSCQVWVRIDPNMASDGVILGCWEANGNKQFQLQWSDFLQAIQLHWRTAADGAAGIDSSVTLNLGTWYCVHFGYSNSVGAWIRINGGILESSGNAAGTYAGLAPLRVGNDSNGWWGIDANIDMLAIWKGYSLTEEDCIHLYNEGAGRPRSTWNLSGGGETGTGTEPGTGSEAGSGTEDEGTGTVFPDYDIPCPSLHYGMEEETGETRKNSVTNNYDLSDAVPGVTQEEGKLGNSAGFTGNLELNNWLVSHSSTWESGTGSPFVWDGQNMTFACWIWLDSAINDQFIISKVIEIPSAGNEYLLWFDGTAGQFKFRIGSAGGYEVTSSALSGSAASKTGKWYFVACGIDHAASPNSQNRNAIWISVNGGEEDRTALGMVFEPTGARSAFVIGHSSSSNNYQFHGRMDELYIWSDTALSPGHVVALYNEGEPLPYDEQFLGSCGGRIETGTGSETETGTGDTGTAGTGGETGTGSGSGLEGPGTGSETGTGETPGSGTEAGTGEGSGTSGDVSVIVGGVFWSPIFGR